MLVLLSTLLPVLADPALAQRLAWRHYGAEAGLPSANAAAFDEEGALLVGTNDGVVHFDGDRFTPLSLPPEWRTGAKFVATAPDGVAWVLSQNNELYRLPPNARAQAVPLPADFEPETWRQRFRVDPQGAPWINDAHGRLWRYDVAAQQWSSRAVPGSSRITDFAFRGDTLWVLDEQRLVRLDPALGADQRVTPLGTFERPLYVLPHPTEEAWVVTFTHVYLIGRQGEVKAVQGAPDHEFAWFSAPGVDREGRLAVRGNRPLGIHILTPDGRLAHTYTASSGLRDDHPGQLLFDRENALWVGHGSGLSYLEQTHLVSFPIWSEGGGQTTKNIRRSPDGRTLWVSTWGGLYAFEDDQIRRVSTEPGVATTVASVRRDGSVWWGEHEKGHYAHMPGRGLRRTDGEDHFLFEASDGTTVTMRPSGLYLRRDGRTHRLREEPSAEIQLVEAGGRLWLGLVPIEGDSLGSACRSCLSPDLRRIADRFATTPVNELTTDAYGRVWAATGPGTLVSLSRTAEGTWHARVYDRDHEGLLGGVTTVHATQDGRLWVGTWRGLQGFQLRPGTTDLGTPYMELRAQDGLAGDFIRALHEDEAGYLWIGAGTGQLQRLVWRRLPQLTSPSLYLLRLERDGVPISSAEVLRFRSPRTRLSVQFGVHTYRQPHRVALAYRLAPLDTAWTLLGSRRRIEFAALPAGRHTLEVRAMRAGSPPGPVLQQALVVNAPLYLRWWFLLLLGAAMALPFWLWNRHRLAKRLAVEQLRLRIATDLHDDIGSGLTRVSIYSELIRREAAGSPAAWAEQVGETARSLTESMRDIVWAISPEHDRWDDLALRMKDAAPVLLDPAGIAFSMEGEAAEGAPPLSMNVKRNLLLIFKETLHNACRHAGCSRIETRYTLDARRLHLTITDDGRGFDPASVRPGNGLVNLRRRAGEIGAALEVCAAPGRGTTVSVHLEFSDPRPRVTRTGDAAAPPAALSCLPPSSPSRPSLHDPRVSHRG